jgi:hypothetical protein
MQPGDATTWCESSVPNFARWHTPMPFFFATAFFSTAHYRNA